MSLAGKRAVVTGAASGIGAACAVRLARDGADVAVMDINPAGLDGTAARIEAEGRRCLPVTVDLMDRAALRDAFARVKAELGSIDILNNVAGGSSRKGRVGFGDADDERWDSVVGLNLTATADCCRLVINDMKARGEGRIINTGSEYAFRGGFGFTEYVAAKKGVIGLTQCLSVELAPFRVTANTVCPGITNTPALTKLPKEHIEAAVERNPMQTMCEPEDIAHAVSFFASPGAWFVTGNFILVDGGRIHI